MTVANTQPTSARRMGAGAIFRDDQEAILLVKPSYKDHWEIPGGAIEYGESPRACCDRELLEELGEDVNLKAGRLLVVDWTPATEKRTEGLMFVFDGGRLATADCEAIKLQRDELVEWRFVNVGDVGDYLPDFMARRIQAAHACAMDGGTLDLELGYAHG